MQIAGALGGWSKKGAWDMNRIFKEDFSIDKYFQNFTEVGLFTKMKHFTEPQNTKKTNIVMVILGIGKMELYSLPYCLEIPSVKS